MQSLGCFRPGLVDAQPFGWPHPPHSSNFAQFNWMAGQSRLGWSCCQPASQPASASQPNKPEAMPKGPRVIMLIGAA